MTGPVLVNLLPGDAARVCRGEVEQVFAEAFTEAPYFKTRRDIAAMGKRLESHSRRPRFLLSAGCVDDTLAGVAYGFALGADTGWWDDVLEPVPEEMTIEDGRRSFAIFELAVRPRFQRQGVGRAVHARLLRALRSERVILNCRQDADPAQAFYRALGYRRVTSVIPWQDAPVYDVLVLDLSR